MHPLLALALVALAGIGVTRLSVSHARVPASLHPLVAVGAPFVLLGLLLGPGVGVLDGPTLRALAPVIALGIGWMGATFGAELEWRRLRRIPRRLWVLGAVLGAAVFAATALAAWLLVHAVSALSVVWQPAAPAVLTLAAVATISERRLPRAVRRVALLQTTFAVLAFAITLAVYHPPGLFGGDAAGWAGRLVLTGVASGVVALLFLWVARLRPDPTALGLDLLGAILLGAGLAHALGLSPFIVCACATGVAVSVSPSRRRVRALLRACEDPIYMAFLVATGALLRFPTPWLLPAVVLLGLVRVAARWLPVRFGRAWRGAGGAGPAIRDLPRHFGLATVAQGGAAVALAINFELVYGSALVTTVVLGVVLAAAMAGPLFGLALHPTPLTGAPPRAEVI